MCRLVCFSLSLLSLCSFHFRINTPIKHILLNSASHCTPVKGHKTMSVNSGEGKDNLESCQEN